MNIIFKIARAELRHLFYAPIAWLVLLLFYVSSAFLMADPLTKFTALQEVLLELQKGWLGFDTGIGIQVFGGILGDFLEKLYLFIPLLTMGVINREVNSGTIKLLYSSPVSPKEIVLGKYIGLVCFNLIVLGTFIFVFLSLCSQVENADYAWAWTSTLGFFLLMNTYAAIGMFLSSMVNYQVIAAMLTFMVLFLLGNLLHYGQEYALVRDVTWAMSMMGKGELLVAGLLTSRELVYFVLITILFIGLTIIRVESRMHAGKKLQSFLKAGALTLIICTIGVLSAMPGYIWYKDVTDIQQNTIHKNTQKVLAQLDGSPVKITYYVNLLGANATHALPSSINFLTKSYWDPFRRFYPNMEFDFEYYYDLLPGDSAMYYKYPGKNIHEIAAIEAEIAGINLSLFKKPEEVKGKLPIGNNIDVLAMHFTYKNKSATMRTFYDPEVWPEETNYASCLKSLATDKQYKIGFSVGHYERDVNDGNPRDYLGHTKGKKTRGALVHYSVSVDTVSLESGVDPEIDVLVLADPRSAYSAKEKEVVKTYINNGGNAILYSEYDKTDMLQFLFDEWGVEPESGQVVRLDNHDLPDTYSILLNEAGNALAEEKFMDYYTKHKIGQASIYAVGSYHFNFKAINGWSIEPVITLKDSEKTWIEKGVFLADSAAPEFSREAGDRKYDEYVFGLKITRSINGKEQRILVFSDGDFMDYLNYSRGTFLLGPYAYVMDNEYPVYGNKPIARDRFLKLSHASSKVFYVVYLFGISGIIAMGGAALLIRRKRK